MRQNRESNACLACRPTNEMSHRLKFSKFDASPSSGVAHVAAVWFASRTKQNLPSVSVVSGPWGEISRRHCFPPRGREKPTKPELNAKSYPPPFFFARERYSSSELFLFRPLIYAWHPHLLFLYCSLLAQPRASLFPIVCFSLS